MLKPVCANKRGSAIITAIVSMLLLFLLGIAVVALSMGSLTVNKADATVNSAYYAGEAGVNSAIEQVKAEVVKYYAQMSEAGSGEYAALYDNFFAGIAANSSARFTEPAIRGISTATTFGWGNYSSADNTADILISCTATAAKGTKYLVTGSVKVRRLDLFSGGGWFVDDVALYAGGSLEVSQWYNGVTPTNASIVCAGYSPGNWAYNTNGSNYNLTVDPSAADAIGDLIAYPSYTTPSFGGSAKEYPAGSYIDNLSGVSEAVIYGRGNLNVTSWSDTSKTIYCDGNLSLSNFGFSGSIYCRGNVTITGGNGFNGKIVCDGNVTLTSCNKSGLILAGGYIHASGGSNVCSMYARGPIELTGGTLGAEGGVIYSCTSVTISGGQASGIYFSGGDIYCVSGATLTRSVLIAKGTIHVSGWLGLSYDAAYIQQIIESTPFFFPNGSGGAGGSVTPDAGVIISQSVKAGGLKY